MFFNFIGLSTMYLCGQKSGINEFSTVVAFSLGKLSDLTGSI